MRELSMADIKHVLYGCAILGTGGGGSLQKGIEEVESVLDGRMVKMISVDEIEDKDIIACPYYVGSISPRDEISLKDLPVKHEFPSVESFRMLQSYMRTSFKAVVPTELGGGNTAVAFQVAALLDIPVVDADPVGRAVPEVQHTSFYLKAVPMVPFSLCNEFGDKLIVTSISSDEQAEEIVRAVAVASNNKVGVTSHPVAGKVFRESIVPGTLTLAWRVSRERENALKTGIDPVKNVVRALNGFLVFEGIALADAAWQDKGGFTYGEMKLEGTGKWKGHEMKIWFKNENLVSWIDGKPYVTSPDLIILLNKDDASPVINPYLKEGQKVSVVASPAPDMWRTPEAVELLGPRHFGFEIEFVPVERRVSNAL